MRNLQSHESNIIASAKQVHMSLLLQKLTKSMYLVSLFVSLVLLNYLLEEHLQRRADPFQPLNVFVFVRLDWLADRKKKLCPPMIRLDWGQTQRRDAFFP
jgi:hypothetical protein